MAHDTKFLRAGIMGYPVMHSRSPLMHNHWMQATGISGVYVPFEVAPDGLEAALRALPALGFAGCNLTIPHKQTAIPLIDRVDPLARRIGAVNCIVVGPNGSLAGSNTDISGYFESLLEAAPDFRADAGRIVMIGAGGGARAVALALADRGAREIVLINRNRARADELAAEFGAPLRVADWSDIETALEGACLLVNTTSLGMVGQPAFEPSLARLPKTAVVSDIVYIPLETPLLKAARLRGHRTVNGLGMLIHQGRPSFAAWTGINPPATAELRALMEATI